MRLSTTDEVVARKALDVNRQRLRQIIADKADAHGGGDVFHDPMFKGLEQEERVAQARVEQLETLLAIAEIVETTQAVICDIGLLVTLENDGEYLITGSASVPHEGVSVISVESPLGQQIVGQPVGSEIYYNVGNQPMQARIAGIRTPSPGA